MENIIEVEAISKGFIRGRQKVQVLSQVTFQVERGECFGIVGDSGSGKTTLANMIAGLEDSDGGTIRLIPPSEVHMVFQNPVQSFNPRLKLGTSIIEGMLNNGVSKNEAKQRLSLLLEECGLSKDYAEKYPHQVSGGECQRAAFARALAGNPDILICDEATSALDTIIQKQLLELIKQLQIKRGLTILMISHNLPIIRTICQHLIVLKNGCCKECGTVDTIFSNSLLKSP